MQSVHSGVVDALESKEIVAAVGGPFVFGPGPCQLHSPSQCARFDDTTDSSAAVRDGEEECEDPRPLLCLNLEIFACAIFG